MNCNLLNIKVIYFIFICFQNYYETQNEILQQNYSIWTNAPSSQSIQTGNINFANNIICNDAIRYDDEFIPFDGSSANKYGPISRSANGIQQSSILNEGMQSSVSSLYSVPLSSPLNSRFYNQCTNGSMQQIASTSLNDTYIALNQDNVDIGFHQDCLSKELVLKIFIFKYVI